MYSCIHTYLHAWSFVLVLFLSCIFNTEHYTSFLTFFLSLCVCTDLCFASLSSLAQCMRCDRDFDTLKNSAEACEGHFDRFGKKGYFHHVYDDDSSSSSDDEVDGTEGMYEDNNFDYGHGNEDVDAVVHNIVYSHKLRQGKAKKKKKERSGETVRGYWTCCLDRDFNNKACKKEPHQMRKIMFAMTMDANPSVRIEDTVPGSSVDLSVINALSISFYPEDKNEIKVQIAHSLSDMLHKYFNINETLQKEILEEKEVEKFNNTRSSILDASSTDLSISLYDNKNHLRGGKEKHKGIGRFFNPFRKKNKKKTVNSDQNGLYCDTDDTNGGIDENDLMSLGDFSATNESGARQGKGDVSLYDGNYDELSVANSSNALSSLNSNRSKYKGSSRNIRNLYSRQFAHNRSHNPQNQNEFDIDKTRNEKNVQEAVYIKYMRVGEIIVNVSTAGFLFNTKGYSACVDPLVLHGKVYDWGRLLLKVEKQAANSVARHTLSHWKDAFVSLVRKTFTGDPKLDDAANNTHHVKHEDNRNGTGDQTPEKSHGEGISRRSSLFESQTDTKNSDEHLYKKREEKIEQEDKYYKLMGVHHDVIDNGRNNNDGLGEIVHRRES